MGKHLSHSERKWLQSHYSYCSNIEIANRFGRSVSSIAYYGHIFHLKKSMELIIRLRRKGARITNEKRKLKKELNGSKKESKR